MATCRRPSVLKLRALCAQACGELELSISYPLKNKVFDQVKLNALRWDIRKEDKGA
jgi:hypothetical protein